MAKKNKKNRAIESETPDDAVIEIPIGLPISQAIFDELKREAEKRDPKKKHSIEGKNTEGVIRTDSFEGQTDTTVD